MLGKLKDLTINRDESQNITITVQADCREMFDDLKDADIDIEIKKHYRSRSLDMNSLCWRLIDQIAEKTNIKKTEVYRNAILEIGGISDTVCVKECAVDKLIEGWTHKGLGWQAEVEPSKLKGCMNVTLYYGSSVFNTKQMSALIDILIQDANELGIPTMSRKEIDRALSVWEKKRDEKE